MLILYLLSLASCSAADDSLNKYVFFCWNPIFRLSVAWFWAQTVVSGDLMSGKHAAGCYAALTKTFSVRPHNYIWWFVRWRIWQQYHVESVEVCSLRGFQSLTFREKCLGLFQLELWESFRAFHIHRDTENWTLDHQIKPLRRTWVSHLVSSWWGSTCLKSL